ncbi:MAG: desulfoferrodoxin FeS4 iron-binding domain-containing protein [Candidatus Omnitrophica bacterium]|nr:desulfoferrodoxin FeS4 iron-binding domain-containing protein [Candidatus Omnitrophota bacterium]
MTELRTLYHCEICKHLIEIVSAGAPTLICCNQPMIKVEPKTEDTGSEKHVPIIENTENGSIIKVGSIEHPMIEEHYIKFIEVLTKERVLRVELKPGQKPEIKCCTKKENILKVREFCTVHGVWQNRP